MAGMLMRKANRVALSRWTPESRPPPRVEPDRLMPGAMATAWHRPMTMAWPKLMSSASILPRLRPIAGNGMSATAQTRAAMIRAPS